MKQKWLYMMHIYSFVPFPLSEVFASEYLPSLLGTYGTFEASLYYVFAFAHIIVVLSRLVCIWMREKK